MKKYVRFIRFQLFENLGVDNISHFVRFQFHSTLYNIHNKKVLRTALIESMDSVIGPHELNKNLHI